MEFDNNNLPKENTENEQNEVSQLEVQEPSSASEYEPPVQYGAKPQSSPEDNGSTVTFETVNKPVEQASNTGVKVFFSIIATVVALIIAVSAGYIFGNKYEDKGGNKFTASTSTVSKENAEYQYDKTVVYNNVNPSVVGISVYTDDTLMGYASGVIYTEDGYIVTNDHIYADVSSPKFLVTFYDGTVLDAEFVAGDTRSDLAVLKVNATGLKKAEFGNYSEVSVGEEVITIGYPLGTSASSVLTSGTVSAPYVRLSSTSSYSMKMIQTDAPINPGNSGGALVNMHSLVIGIPSVKLAGSSYDNVGYAIPSDTVVKVADSLIKNGYVEGRGRLGITYQEINTVTSNITGLPTGLKIATISDDSDLCDKGIKKGDIITHINDVQITSNAVALDIIENTAPNVAMSFTVYHTEEKTSETIYAVLLPDQGNSSYTNKVTEGETNDPFGNGSNLDDFFSDH